MVTVVMKSIMQITDVDLMDSKEYRVSFKSFTSACMVRKSVVK